MGKRTLWIVPYYSASPNRQYGVLPSDLALRDGMGNVKKWLPGDFSGAECKEFVAEFMPDYEIAGWSTPAMLAEARKGATR